jgi:hypothetical protein
MSDDLIEDAISCLRGEGWDNEADAVTELVAEIKRLREIQDVGPHAISVGGKTFLSIDVDENRLKQLAAKDIELTRWQEIARDERANRIIDGGIDSEFALFCAMKGFSEEEKKIWLSEAAKELGIQISREASYVKRLEAAYVVIWRQSYYSSSRAQGLSPGTAESREAMAQAALAKIRAG